MTEYLVILLLSAIVLWLLVGMRGAWLPRAVAIVALVAASLLLLWPENLSGLPTTASPPEFTRFAGCLVDETRGVIYLWLISDKPRGYVQPYTRELHEVCAASVVAHQSGYSVGLRKRRGSGAKPIQGQAIPKDHFQPYLLPPSRGPQKG